MKALLSSTDPANSPPPPSAAPASEAVAARSEAPLTPDEVVKLAFLVARRRVGIHSARDIAQETWLKVAAQAEREPSWTAARARAWVRTVAANAALDQLRRERPAPLESEDAPSSAPDPAEAAELAELSARERAEARGLLAKLSRPDRELLAGRVLEGRSYAELAEQFGLRPSSLRARFTRLRASLQKGDL